MKPAFTASLIALSLLSGCSGGGSHPNRITAIAISPASATIAVGQKQQLNGTATTNGGQQVTSDNSAASWTSSNTSVAAVDQSGLVLAIAVGNATITATVQTGGGPVSGTATLTVTAAALVSIAVTPSSPSAAAGATQQFTATGTFTDNSQHDLGSAAWTSSNTTVATIDSNGLAMALAPGSTIITAASNGISGSVTLTVASASPTLVSVAVTPANPTLTSGAMQQFTATGTYSDNSQQALSSATWSSSNTNVATINGSGVATAIAAGVTTISAATNGVSGSSTLTVAAPQVNISNVTVHTDSPDPQFATIHTSDGTLINIWGAKDSNGLPTAVRTIQVQGSNGKSATFNFDTNGNLVQWSSGSGTVFSLDWQSSTVANFVAYTAGGTAIAGPTQISFPTATATAARRVIATTPKSEGMETTPKPEVLDPVASNTFEVQVKRCGRPVVDASVELSVKGSLLPLPQFVDAPLPSDGTYEMNVPVLIPTSAVASATDLCDYTASVLAPITKAQNIIAVGCFAATSATVIASDLAVGPAAGEIDTECVADLDLMYEVSAVDDVVDPDQPSLLQTFCSQGIPSIVHATNSSNVQIAVTASVPGNPAQTVGPITYSGTGPFPGSGPEPPIVMNFDQGGVCDIAGQWNGSWNRRHKDGTLHLSDLSADVTDTSTPNSYDVDLAVTDSSGITNYSFSGDQTSETDLGFTFGFGPATIDGVSGDAVGFLTPDGKAMSGYYVGLAPGAAGGWSLIKSAATGP